MKIDPWLTKHENLAAGRMAKKAFSITGFSGSGKTTLVEELIVWFRHKGYVVSAIKHAHHGFDIDKPGKDSYRMRDAGAEEVFLVGDKRWVLMREYQDESEPPLEMLLERLAPCDLVLIEGFKESSVPKIEVYRPGLGRLPLWKSNPTIVALASDESYDCPLPVLDLNRPSVIAEYIEKHLALTLESR
jgi:molybdopterin-guanine dinucleotide biosynthesis protein B